MGFATYVDFSCMPVSVGRADDRSFNAATFGGSTPSVTSWWAGARTATEERREGGQWFFEKNKRVVLKMHDENGRCKYWRAPRPRPRPHRRHNRRRGKHIVRAALFNQTPTTAPAAEVIQVLQASLRNSLRRAESAERALQSSRDQLHELRDRQAARPPVEPDLHACSVQQGVDPTAPQATQPVTRRPMFTQTGQDRKQPPPPPKAHFALDHRAAVWSPFRTGGALRAPTEETKAGRQEEKDEDRAAMARCRLQNTNLFSTILDFEVRCSKIKSKLSRLVYEYDGMSDRRREKALSSLHQRVIGYFTEFFEACRECG